MLVFMQALLDNLIKEAQPSIVAAFALFRLIRQQSIY